MGTERLRRSARMQVRDRNGGWEGEYEREGVEEQMKMASSRGKKLHWGVRLEVYVCRDRQPRKGLGDRGLRRRPRVAHKIRTMTTEKMLWAISGGR